jgi:hypothetical protein
MARIKIASAKAKGRKAQQWACEQIGNLLGLPWGKDELIAPREGAQSGTDVRLIGAAQEEFPFAVECKFQESWSVPQWIEQAQANTREGLDWLLIMKRSNKPYVVALDAAAFFKLLDRLYAAEKYLDD